MRLRGVILFFFLFFSQLTLAAELKIIRTSKTGYTSIDSLRVESSTVYLNARKSTSKEARDLGTKLLSFKDIDFAQNCYAGTYTLIKKKNGKTFKAHGCIESRGYAHLFADLNLLYSAMDKK